MAQSINDTIHTVVWFNVRYQELCALIHQRRKPTTGIEPRPLNYKSCTLALRHQRDKTHPRFGLEKRSQIVSLILWTIEVT